MNSKKTVWRDKRSGKLGCFAGNAVLARLKEEEGEPIRNEKGTTFGTSRKLFVCRMNSTDEYLQKGIAHFSNLSMQQHEQVNETDREVFYLFIRVSKNTVHYWMVPAKVIGQILPTLPTKPDNTTRFLRIMERDGKYYLGEKNITSTHHEFTVSPRQITRITNASPKPKTTDPVIKARSGGKVEVQMTYKGRPVRGVLQPA